VTRLRAATDADAEAAAALVIAADIAEVGEVDYSLADLKDEWGAHGFDLTRDAAIVEDEHGIAIGYAHFRDSDVLAVVDPQRDGEGAGTALLDWAEARGRERGHERLGQAIGHMAHSGAALLQSRGWVKVRSYWRLQRDAAPGEPEPAGLRPLTDADAPTLYAIHEAAFASRPEYDGSTEEAWTRREFGAYNLDHGLSRVADNGFALARRWQDGVVYVPLLAVHPDAAGQGLGSRLLQGVFAAAGNAGWRQVQLMVASDNPNALRLYERVGMTQRWRLDAYELALRD
jgi:ribosomal protein S18 acetylase RimI-like enzyme